MLLKQKSLRDFLCKNIPYLTANPEKIRMDVEDGLIEGNLAASLSHRHHYTLTTWVFDWSGNTHLLFTLVSLWLRRHQPDIMATEAARKTGFRYELADLDGSLQNLNFSLKLSERVIVEQQDNELTITPQDEPPLPDGEIDPLDVYLDGIAVVKGATP